MRRFIFLIAAALCLSSNLENAYGATSNIANASQGKEADVLSHYIKVQEAFAADSLEAAKTAAGDLEKATAAVKTKEAGAVNKQAKLILAAKDIKAAREAFKPTFEPMASFSAKDPSVKPAFCPMANARWYQRTEKIANPYYGKSMLECGVFEKKK